MTVARGRRLGGAAIWAGLALCWAGCSGAPPTAPGPCVGDDDCPFGRHCEAETCVRECAIDEDCAGGAMCVAMRGRCQSPLDAGADARVVVCVSASDCDDDVFCNGAERCAPGASDADPDGCAPGVGPCGAGETCDELAGECQLCTENADADGDRVNAVSCGGTDCDDGDSDRFPGNPERCDPTDFGHDEDCSPTTFGRRDVDGDGFVDVRCNNSFGGLGAAGNDCNDAEFRSRPGLTENPCDGIDNDCSGAIDDAATPTYYADIDGDGYGAAADGAVEACMPPADYVERDGDCAPRDEAINPGRSERCDGIDDNCDGAGDEELEGLACGTMLPGRCSSGRTACESGSPDPICRPEGGGIPSCTAGVSRDCSVCGLSSGTQVCNGCDYGSCALRSSTLTVGIYTSTSPGIVCANCAGTGCGGWEIRGPVVSVPSGLYEIRLTGARFPGAGMTPDGFVHAIVDGVDRGSTGGPGGEGLATSQIRVTGVGCHSLEVAVACGPDVASYSTSRLGD